MPLTKESTARSAKAGDLTLGYYEAGQETSVVGGGLPMFKDIEHHIRLDRLGRAAGWNP